MEFTSTDKIWLPCSRINNTPIAASADGSYITLNNGKTIIDAFSSWWCKSLGHGHPRLKQAVIEQIAKCEHIAMADMATPAIIELSNRLCSIMPSLDKIFYASDGSSAVEIALKMSLHFRKLNKDKNKSKFISLKNSYHGETVGAMSVSGLDAYRHTYRSMLFESSFITPPYVSGENDQGWDDCSEIWPKIEQQLDKLAREATAIIVEPIVQGAGNMQVYSKDFLKKLSHWSLANDVHLIADEVMTGFGRTGKMFACQHAGITPDFIAIGKGLTSGWLPMSAVLIKDRIHHEFQNKNNFLHSHTFSGNALAAAVAVETLNIFADENICSKAEILGYSMIKHMENIASSSKKLKNVRGIGAIVAADLATKDPGMGDKVCQLAFEHGAWLRNLGNTIYWLPPLNTDEVTISQLSEITYNAIVLA